MNLDRCELDDVSRRARSVQREGRCFSSCVALNDRVHISRVEDDAGHNNHCNNNHNLEAAISSLFDERHNMDEDCNKGMSNKLTVTFAEKTKVHTVECDREDRESKWYSRDEWRAMRREVEQAVQAAGYHRNHHHDSASDVLLSQQQQLLLQQQQHHRHHQQQQQRQQPQSQTQAQPQSQPQQPSHQHPPVQRPSSTTDQQDSGIAAHEARHCPRGLAYTRFFREGTVGATRRRRCRRRRFNNTVIFSVLVEQLRLGSNQHSIATTSSSLSRRDVKSALRRAAVDAAEVKQDLIEYAMRRIQQGIVSPCI